MTLANLHTAVNRAAQMRNDAIAAASRSAPDYDAFDAATRAAELAYQRTVRNAYRRLAA